MVSWIVSPYIAGNEGFTGGFARFTTSGTQPVRVIFDAYAYKLLTAGSVDLNGVTRFQYYVPEQDMPVFVGGAAFRYTAADAAAYPGRYLTGTAFRANASSFAPGVIPTPAQIIANAIEVQRGAHALGGSNPSGITGAGDLPLLMAPPDGHIETPNTKYWYCIAPTHVASMASTASIANDLPVGDPNVNGRAVSLWTNRTPLAPLIISPSGQSTVFAGTEIDFAYQGRDPDRISTFPGDIGPTDFHDIAGVQVQYSKRPTDDDPTPPWSDLPITDVAGGTFGRGWAIDGSVTGTPPHDGANQLWLTGKMKILCGTINPHKPSSGYLPGGDWLLRMRTFDYGHPLPDATDSNPYLGKFYPLGDTLRTYIPDTYPAANTSPWSDPVRVIVSEQIPQPVAISPINGAAMVDSDPVTLVWQYRNTYTPPFPQMDRSIQIRRVGDPVWGTVVDQDGSPSNSWMVDEDAFPLVSGNQYEWRVQTVDTTGTASLWSEPAHFWVVPLPASGEIIPLPGDTVDGATLGCGTHRVFVYRQGGKERVGEIKNISSVEWNRVRDDLSTAKIVVSDWDIDCGNLLASLQTWAYELVIFRNNGYSNDRVWEGPITLLTYERDSVTVHAKDVMAYAYRRIVKQAMSDFGKSPTAGDTVVQRAERVMLNAFAPSDPNVLAYLHVLQQPDDARQYRSMPAYSKTAFEEIDDMAANAGLDYTTVGRAVLLWGTKHRIGTLPEFRDKDLGASPIVSEYGMSFANRYAVSDGNGVYGEATRLDEKGEDPVYGLVEMLSSTWASDSEAESGTYTEAGLATVRASFAAASERSISARFPPPVVVRVPDNTRLNPDTVLSVQSLVPGVVVPLRSTSTLRTVVATQKLDAVKCIESGGTETITITLSPFSRDDVDPGEGGEE